MEPGSFPFSFDFSSGIEMTQQAKEAVRRSLLRTRRRLPSFAILLKRLPLF
jgi:hypothetical protein